LNISANHAAYFLTLRQNGSESVSISKKQEITQKRTSYLYVSHNDPVCSFQEKALRAAYRS